MNKRYKVICDLRTRDTSKFWMCMTIIINIKNCPIYMGITGKNKCYLDKKGNLLLNLDWIQYLKYKVFYSNKRLK